MIGLVVGSHRSSHGRWVRTHTVTTVRSSAALAIRRRVPYLAHAMLIEAYNMFALIHRATPGVGRVSCWQRPKLALQINDATSGV